MFTSSRLTKAFNQAQEIKFDYSSKFIFFSDCHRGDNSWKDDFANNQDLFFHALNDYYRKGFTYIELGDGEELWENKKFIDIQEAYSNIYWLFKKFHQKKRLHLIFGNHNALWKNPKNVEKFLFYRHKHRNNKTEEFLKDIQIHEALILKNTQTNQKIFLTHGHQGDLMSDILWPLGRFLVRYIWAELQAYGIKDPTSPAKNFKKRQKTEKLLIKWVEDNHQMLIAGHTHRPVFPRPDKTPYFNDGSCVHPRCIVGIEIEKNAISLIKWLVKPTSDGLLKIIKETLAGPENLKKYQNY